MPTPQQVRAALPALATLDDDQLVDAVHGLYFANESRDQVAARLGVAPPPAPAPPPPGFGGHAKDLGISLLKGAVDIPEAAVGLADIPTGGRVGKFLDEEVGFRPAEAKAFLDNGYSEAQKESFRKVGDARGFVDTAKAVAQNPSVIVQGAAESLPSMLAGGAISRAALKVAPAMSGALAGAIGEGGVAAGQQVEQTREETPGGVLTPEQVALTAGSGLIDAVLSFGGSKVAHALGATNVATWLSGKSDAVPGVSKLRQVLAGGGEEGLQEFLQSTQEQILQNKAEGKPLDEGVDQAGILGLTTGMMMGAGANAMHSASHVALPAPPTPGDAIRATAPPVSGPTSRAAAVATETTAQQVDANPTAALAPDGPVPVLPDVHDDHVASVLDHANARSAQLAETEKGVPEQVIKSEDPEGADHVVPAVEARHLTPDEKLEQQFLNEHGGDAQAVAAHYRNLIPNIQRQMTVSATHVATPEELAAVQPDTAMRAGDIGPGTGTPFTTRGAALRALTRMPDAAAHAITPVDGGHVIRPNEAPVPLPPAADETPTITAPDGSQRATFPDQAAANKYLKQARKAQGVQGTGVKPVQLPEGHWVLATKAEQAHIAELAAQVQQKAVEAQQPAPEVQQTAPEVKQPEPEWKAFPPETGTLGIPRSEMPQVAAEHRGALVNFLKARGVTAEPAAEMDSRELKATQAEFSPAKVQRAREHTGGQRSILVSSDGHVVDGHHQAIAAQGPISVIRLNAPIRDLIPMVHDFPSSTRDGVVKPPAAPEPVVPPIVAKARKARAAKVVAEAPVAAPKLPGELASAKPRYSFGAKQFTLDFASDVDRAAYIAAGEKASKRDADYVKFARDASGMSEKAVREHGKMIRSALKEMARAAEKGGSLQVPDQLAAPPMQDRSRTGTPAVMDKLAAQGYERTDAPKVRVAERLNKLMEQINSGEMTEAVFVDQVDKLAREASTASNTKQANRMTGERERGLDIVREKIIAAMRRGEISRETGEFAQWLINRDAHLTEGLGISVRTAGAGNAGSAGQYNGAARIMTLFKDATNAGTAVHEILHHTERMMPAGIQDGIHREWAKRIARAIAAAGTVNGKTHQMTPRVVALEAILDAVANPSEAKQQAVHDAFHDGRLDYDTDYQLVNPSEFWAVNATDILQRAYHGQTWMARAKAWLSAMVQRVKSILGLQSDHAVLRGIEAVINGDGSDQSRRMLSEQATHLANQPQVNGGRRNALRALAGSAGVAAGLRGLQVATGSMGAEDAALVKATAPASAPARGTVLHDLQRPTLDAVRAVRLPMGYTVDDFMGGGSGKIGLWHKTLGTPYHLAQKYPAFKRVFDGIQSFLNDVSYHASDAADLAPTMLPKLEGWRDLGKSPISVADTQAISPALFSDLDWVRDENGTPRLMSDDERQASARHTEAVAAATARNSAKAAQHLNDTVEQKRDFLLRGNHVTPEVMRMWEGRPKDEHAKMVDTAFQRALAEPMPAEPEGVKPGVVFTDAELKQHFKLDDRQVGLYREFRAAVDRSLDHVVTSQMLRIAGADATPEVRAAAQSIKNAGQAAEILKAHLEAMAASTPDRAETLRSTAETLGKLGDHIEDLKARGYAPRSRFGTLALDVVGKDGERQYFQLFETAADRKRVLRQLKESGQFEGSTFTQGTTSQEKYKLFSQMSPDTVELFGDMIGLSATGAEAGDVAFQEFLKRAKANTSAMKHLIHRTGVEGFSRDAGRVLAGFVYSNSRLTSNGLHASEVTKAVNDIPQGQGQLTDAAYKLMSYVQNPQEEAAGLKGLMFAQYLGGSVASAFVNATQPFMTTLPYLSQHGGLADAAKHMAAAAKLAARGGKTGDAALDAAMEKYSDAIQPQEVHQMMAQAQGRAALHAGDGTRAGNAAAATHNAMSKIGMAWGKVFGVAESLNRRLTFIAAYNQAVAHGVADPGAAANKAVAETQFIMNKGNKPQWARGPVGSVLFCVDETTEALTSEGWKTYDQLQPGDLLASFDMETETLSWKPMESVHAFDHDGEMLHVRGKSLDMLTTLDHRCVTYRKRRVVGKRATGETYDAIEVHEAQNLRKHDRIPTGAEFEHVAQGKPISDAMARVIGWVVTEGCFYGDGYVTLRQNEDRGAKEIRTDLREAGFTWTETKWRYKGGNADSIRFFMKKSICGELRSMLPGKQLTPALLMRMTTGQIRQLVDTMIAGDGHVNKKTGARCFIQNPGQTLDAFQMALTMLGLSYSVRKHGKGCRAVLIRESTPVGLSGAKRERVHYTGKVWCPIVPGTHTWVARRNGMPFITHNTFKQYSISYLEMMQRLATTGAPGSPERAAGRRAALYAIGAMLMMAGADGLPFIEDIDDVIDGVLQRMGYNFHSKQAREAFFRNLFGEDLGKVMTKGLSGLPGAPLDVSGRLGMSNLIPGTGLLIDKTDHTSDLMELGGPAADMAKRFGSAAVSLAQGNVGDAVTQAAPKALANAIQASSMWQSGMYKDQNGKKVIDTDFSDGLSKFIGFQPRDVADAQNANFAVTSMVAENRLKQSQIADAMAKARFEHDEDAYAAARATLDRWNANNPDTPIRIKPADIRTRVKNMNMTKQERTIKASPAGMRQTVRERLAAEAQ